MEVILASIMETLQSLRNEIKSINNLTCKNPRALIIRAPNLHTNPKETDFVGPPLPLQFVQRFKSKIPSDPNSKQSKSFAAAEPKKHSDKRKHKSQAKYVTFSSSSEESEASVRIKMSSKPKGASSEQGHSKSHPNPLQGCRYV